MPKKISVTIGRIVGYVLPVGHNRLGEVVPAVVTRVFTKGSDMVQLTPFIDVANDRPMSHTDCSSVHFDETKQPRTWHWLPRE